MKPTDDRLRRNILTALERAKGHCNERVSTVILVRDIAYMAALVSHMTSEELFNSAYAECRSVLVASDNGMCTGCQIKPEVAGKGLCAECIRSVDIELLMQKDLGDQEPF